MIAQSSSNPSYTQADGAVVVNTPSRGILGHQVSFGGDATVGTLAFEVKYHKDANFETLFESDGTTPKVVDLSSAQTFEAEGIVHSFQVTPTGVDASYKVLVISGVEDED